MKKNDFLYGNPYSKYRYSSELVFKPKLYNYESPVVYGAELKNIEKGLVKATLNESTINKSWFNFGYTWIINHVFPATQINQVDGKINLGKACKQFALFRLK